jgi:hypothetical protein
VSARRDAADAGGDGMPRFVEAETPAQTAPPPRDRRADPGFGTPSPSSRPCGSDRRRRDGDVGAERASAARRRLRPMIAASTDAAPQPQGQAAA